MKENYWFGTFCAICSAVTSFLFGIMCVFFGFKSGDISYAPFAIMGLCGSLVMYSNRK
jgi:prepilin signal peptidase PulO-like enzyme (type II secretory pathway)